MIGAVGQPQKSTFEKMKTIYWYETVKERVCNELISACEEEISQINKRKSSGRKYSASRLRTLNNKLLRLEGKGDFKKGGPKFSEINNHIIYKAGILSGKSVLTADEAYNVGGKIWSRYANGTYTPSRILNYVEKIYKGTRENYDRGPFNLFHILEQQTISEAFEVFKTELAEYLLSSSRSNVGNSELQTYLNDYLNELKKPFNFENVYLQINKFEEVLRGCEGEVFEDDFLEFGHRAYINASDQIISPLGFACFYLSLGAIKFKFLGDYRLLMYAVCRADVLMELEVALKINKKLWFTEDGKADECPVISLFKKLKEMPDFVHPEEGDLPIFNVRDSNKVSFNRKGRFTGIKVR
jgi:hypothetical protein